MQKLRFYFVVFLFLLLAPLFLLYSQGFRIDFDNKTIVQTGGIFIKAYPKRAVVSVGKVEKLTDPWFGSAFFDNLIPRQYLVRVSKEGFLSWSNEVQVLPGKVTEIRNINLPKENLRFKELSRFSQIFLDSQQRKAVVVDSSKLDLKLVDFKAEVKTALLKEEELRSEDPKLLNIYWPKVKNSNYVIAVVSNKDKVNYLKIDLKERKAEIFTLPQDEILIEIYPFSQFAVLVFLDSASKSIPLFKIKKLDYQLLNLSPLASQVLAYTIYFNNLIWMNLKGEIFQLSLSPLSNLESLGRLKSSLPQLKGDVEKRIFPLSSFNFILELGDSLYNLNLNSLELQKISSEVKSWANFKGLFLAGLNSKGLFIYNLKSGQQYFFPQFKDYSKVEFVDPYRLLILKPKEGIFLLELSLEFKLQQIWKVVNLEVKDFYYFPESKKILVIQDDKVLVSTPLF